MFLETTASAALAASKLRQQLKPSNYQSPVRRTEMSKPKLHELLIDCVVNVQVSVVPKNLILSINTTPV